MSHDRGCPCGREKYEYEECKGKHSMKQEKRYVRVRNDGTAHILTLEELKNVPESVILYELGPRVRVKTTIDVVPASRRTEI